MTETQWLDEREQRAWRSLMTMQDGLSEFLERQLRNRCGLSTADYQVLAHLSEAPEGRLRSFELGQLLRWEKSRLSQHLGRMQNRGLVTRERCLTDQRGAIAVITPRGGTAHPGHHRRQGARPARHPRAGRLIRRTSAGTPGGRPWA